MVGERRGTTYLSDSSLMSQLKAEKCFSHLTGTIFALTSFSSSSIPGTDTITINKERGKGRRALTVSTFFHALQPHLKSTFHTTIESTQSRLQK